MPSGDAQAMSTTVALIGSGRIGSTVARLAVAAGIDVVLSNSRGPHTLTGLVEELGSRASAGTAAEAAASADLVVATIPFFSYKELPADALAGRIVLDTMNFDPGRDGEPPAELADGTATTSELVQRHLPGSQVVKIFNTIYYTHLENLARPASAPDRSALPLAADDPAAKAEVTALLDRLGWAAVDAGSLADSWRMALRTPVFVAPYMASPDFSTIATDPGKPTPASQIQALLAAATR
jgi:8-hydroxy-5-deazaflavin:NADPH oxidoreductase